MCESSWTPSLVSRPPPPEEPPPSRFVRWWRSGQFPVALGALAFLGAMFLPLLGDVRLREGSTVVLGVSVRPIDLALNTVSAIRGGMSAWLLPGAAGLLLSLLRSRRTSAQMHATRPLLVVVALAPVVSAGMPFVLLRKHGLSPTPGAALGLVALGVAFTLFAATRFGDGVDEPPRHRPDDDEHG